MRWRRWPGEAGATSAQVAIAWLLAKPAVTAPIASATSLEQLDDLVKAASLRLSAAQVAALDAASAEVGLSPSGHLGPVIFAKTARSRFSCISMRKPGIVSRPRPSGTPVSVSSVTLA